MQSTNQPINQCGLAYTKKRKKKNSDWNRSLSVVALSVVLVVWGPEGALLLQAPEL